MTAIRTTLDVDAVQCDRRPLFLADWRDALFIHYDVRAEAIQPSLSPTLELDTFGGRAYLSLVLFTQSRLRPAWGGRATEWLSRPVGRHAFLNVRTYVRHGADRGIYFLAEWIPNRLAVAIGPWLYGLPYRWGDLHYNSAGNVIRRTAATPHGSFHCAAVAGSDFRVARSASICEFLVERYAAYTCRSGVLRQFRIAHAPWLVARAEVNELDDGLLRSLPLPDLGTPVAAHFSPGVVDVRIGRPERLVV